MNIENNSKIISEELKVASQMKQKKLWNVQLQLFSAGWNSSSGNPHSVFLAVEIEVKHFKSGGIHTLILIFQLLKANITSLISAWGPDKEVLKLRVPPKIFS